MDRKIYTGHFYNYFPGGSYRKATHPRSLQLMKDLDRLVIELSFGLDKFHEEMASFETKLEKCVSLLDTDYEGAVKLRGEAKAHEKVCYILIYPIYEEMLKLGYTRIELTG